MLIRVSPAGFSLIECMIAVALFSLLTMLALPNFTAAIQDAQVRSAAQSITSGLQLARAEAIRRNASVRFRFPNTLGDAPVDGGTDWRIQADASSDPAVTRYTTEVQKRNGLESSPNARVGFKTVASFDFPAAPADQVTDIIFTPLGRLSTPGRQIDVVNITSTASRRLSIALSAGGQVRLCEPKVAVSTNPQGCD